MLPFWVARLRYLGKPGSGAKASTFYILAQGQFPGTSNTLVCFSLSRVPSIIFRIDYAHNVRKDLSQE